MFVFRSFTLSKGLKDDFWETALAPHLWLSFFSSVVVWEKQRIDFSLQCTEKLPRCEHLSVHNALYPTCALWPQLFIFASGVVFQESDQRSLTMQVSLWSMCATPRWIWVIGIYCCQLDGQLHTYRCVIRSFFHPILANGTITTQRN